MNFEEYYISDINGKSNCVVRSFCKTFNKEYGDVYNDLCIIAQELNRKSFNDVEVFETYMKRRNMLPIEYGKDLKIRDLKLDFGKYIVFCFDKKDYYHMVTIIDNVLYDKNNESIDLYVIKIYKEKTFRDEINELESLEFDENYVIKKGNVPILFTAPHTMNQVKEDGSIKPGEPYTKAVALYLNKYNNVNCMIKLKDTGLDANRDNRDDFKKELIRFIKDNHVRLVIDLHGANKERKFDVEFGTMNNLTADFSTVKELEEAFVENGIKNISYNEPFKGGAITQYIFGLKDVDIIQVEINGRYRDDNEIEKLEKLVVSFENFIKMYEKYINK